MQQTLLTIDGMDSEDSAERVEQALTRATGVHSVQVSLLKRNASVQFDDAQATPLSLAVAVADAGYVAHPQAAPRGGCCGGGCGG